MSSRARAVRSWWGSALALGLILTAFQNCARLASDPQTDAGPIGYSSVKSDADLAWSLRSTTLPTAGRLGQVSRWLDGKLNQVALYPPLMPNTNALDLNRAPLVEQTTTGSILRFEDNDQLGVQYGDSPRFVSDAYTITMYVRNLTMPTEGLAYLRLLQMVPGDLSDSGQLVVDVTLADGDRALIQTYEVTGGGSTTAKVYVPRADLNGGLGIAVSFANDGKLLRLAVNGVLSDPAEVSGAGVQLGRVSRRPWIHGYDGQLGGTFRFADFGIWMRASADLELTMNSFALRRAMDVYGTSVVPTAAGAK